MQNSLFVISLMLLLMTTCLTSTIQEPRENHANDKIAYENESGIRYRRATQKPGFFKTLFSVVYEQWADTRDTFSKVSKVVNENVVPDNAPVRVPELTTISNDPNATTTKMPYRITRSELNKIIRRNLKGLNRLYMLELDDALKQSKQYDREFRKNATIEISKFL